MEKQWDGREWLRRAKLNGGGVAVASVHLPCKSSASEKIVMASEEERCTNTKRRHDDGSKKMNENGDKIVSARLLTTLSIKEKEEDFMIMKGCKPSQRPKKRAKSIQKTMLMMSPGAWLTDICRERYQVREKTCKKKPSGLKAMQSMEVDLE